MLLTRSGPNVAEASQRMITAAMKAAATDTVEYWHERFLPIHFTEEGFDRYGYQLRKGQDESNLVYADTAGMRVREGRYGRLINNPKYYWRKWRQKHTHDPLVFTGESKRRALQSIRVSVKNVDGSGAGGAGGQGGNVISASGVLDLPRYFYQYNKAYGAPDKADELLRTTAEEEQQLAGYYDRAMGRAISSATAPSSTRRIA